MDSFSDVPVLFFSQWPGYEVNFCESIDLQNITVARLAGKVASIYTKFFEVRSSFTHYRGPADALALPLQTMRDRRCGPGGLKLTPQLVATLRVISILSMPENVYQAEVGFDP